ncbi:hypothetical protein [Bdellovibrio sp. KM01]|uniref:hypothetical protein n=1 Tax=Bdellovibrio sp. KM01 TaxID=2748865 RepID=UPI0015EA0C9A|nr:hypothetical protein [Bdellovibrio sp. KM01]QLY24890.1 hypothetical protein HW988_15880 [Bdellovibrio sp. KM01]
MKVVQFNSEADPYAAYIKDPVDLFCSLFEGNPHKVICFLDLSNLCTKYWTQNHWIEEVCDQVVLVTEDIIESFAVTKVPMFQFYLYETEVHEICGTATENTVRLAIKQVAERV